MVESFDALALVIATSKHASTPPSSPHIARSMNYGIIHNRRRDNKAGDAPNPFLSDPRMREMAKQMGLEPKDFGSEAMNVWNMLNNMAESDPTAYQNFINEQLKAGPPVDPSSGADSSASKRPRYFNPKPGYVVKCTMLGPVKQQMVEQKLFLNLCFHEIIDMPKNPNSNKDVPRDSRAVPTTNNLQIPLVIGTLREIKDFNGSPCKAIDVVFHPWVFDRCEWDAKFKRDVLSLAITWVQQDAKVTLTSPVGKFIKSQYKGGVAIGSEILTANFPIDPEQQQTRTLDVKFREDSPPSNQDEVGARLSTDKQSVPPPTTTIEMSSPSDLLKKLSVNDLDETEKKGRDFIIAPTGQKENKAERQQSVVETQRKDTKKLIEVIEPVSSTKSVPKASAKPKDGAVKRGFLNSTKKPLYPKGSSEGRPASAYVNLLSRSKVVDMNTVSNEQQQERLKRAKEKDELLSFLQPTAEPSNNNNEVDHGDREFEQLCMEADPDLVPANSRTGSGFMDDALFGEHLDDFTRLLSNRS